MEKEKEYLNASSFRVAYLRSLSKKQRGKVNKKEVVEEKEIVTDKVKKNIYSDNARGSLEEYDKTEE